MIVIAVVRHDLWGRSPVVALPPSQQHATLLIPICSCPAVLFCYGDVVAQFQSNELAGQNERTGGTLEGGVELVDRLGSE